MTPYFPDQPLRSSSQSFLVVLSAKFKTKDDCSFAVLTRNNLPSPIRSVQSLDLSHDSKASSVWLWVSVCCVSICAVFLSTFDLFFLYSMYTICSVLCICHFSCTLFYILLSKLNLEKGYLHFYSLLYLLLLLVHIYKSWAVRSKKDSLFLYYFISLLFRSLR